MSNGLYSGLLDDEDPGEKKTLAQCQLACYGIIKINLTDSCRDVLRRLKTKDPRKCWVALIAEYDHQTAASQMMLLVMILNFHLVRGCLVGGREWDLSLNQPNS